MTAPKLFKILPQQDALVQTTALNVDYLTESMVGKNSSPVVGVVAS